ncbi:MAG: hypothetical protein L7W43_18240 [Rubripirellula sp.]|nr:hypothetical protein [Rubripirellula sp.]
MKRPRSEIVLPLAFNDAGSLRSGAFYRVTAAELLAAELLDCGRVYVALNLRH